MPESLTFAPTSDPRRVRAPDGRVLSVPEGWVLLPPGDAGLTRRVKAAGPTWTVVEKVGRKLFSRGVWAPEPHILQAKAALDAERATPAYARKLAAGRDRRAREQEQYEVDFANSVLRFLAFSPAWLAHAKKLAVLVSAHATPVGSGTVARTERIPVERRAEAAVIAWMRHQTTQYDDMSIARVKGARREVRRELAEISRAVLDLHRRDVPHGPSACPLCTALARVGAGTPQP
ncbi:MULTISPECIES: DUF2293 domain-containing protein [unclassified Myxococcus]|jgi:hypothetical protein|uniref:DUF2293 domain-containing protein n=1 Tax=Myxococcus TaxID=32 RepID=UPI001CBAB4F1|nr:MULTISPECIES: DUF2293 domain-containing protein [unclassified Myxococcus]MBZ4395706.1 DUF2293 domain-containing protein [Myxococcus sp. AS-1-15]MBZ4411322.1 DUF2293 domain-containing protein [Myxococcus sp. XM-1-1-1]BDT31065.1 DUF2293 domain-containing protein [Myxococcus sp. MH1]